MRSVFNSGLVAHIARKTITDKKILVLTVAANCQCEASALP